jgi:hypothetical protein
LVAPSGDVNLQGDIWTTDQTGATGYNPGGPGREEPSGDVTGHFGGTSAATPVAAGVAALIWSDSPGLKADQVRLSLESTAIKVDPGGGAWAGGRSKYYGLGKVDALAALNKAKGLAAASIGPASGLLARAEPAEGPTTGDDVRADSGQRLLEQALQPSPVQFQVRGGKVELEPHTDQIAVHVDEAPNAAMSAISKVVKPSEQQRVMDQVSIASRGGTPTVAVIPRSALRDERELKAAARRGDLPRLSPVYRSRGSLVVAEGTITCRLKSPGDEPKLLELAKGLGLEKVGSESEKGEVRLKPRDRAAAGTLWDAVRALQKCDAVRWCEPDLSRSFNKLEGGRK